MSVFNVIHHQLYHHLDCELALPHHQLAHRTSRQYVCGLSIIVCCHQVYQKQVSTGANEIHSTLQLAVYHQSTVVAVTVQLPSQIKVTNQLLLTVATLVLLLYQVTHCSQASDGVMVAIN